MSGLRERLGELIEAERHATRVTSAGADTGAIGSAVSRVHNLADAILADYERPPRNPPRGQLEERIRELLTNPYWDNESRNIRIAAIVADYDAPPGPHDPAPKAPPRAHAGQQGQVEQRPPERHVPLRTLVVGGDRVTEHVSDGTWAHLEALSDDYCRRLDDLRAITTALDASGIQGGTPAERIERLASDRDSHMLAQAAAVAEVERLRADAVAARLSELETLIDHDEWRLAEQKLATLTETLGASHPEIVGLTALLEAEKATGREPEAERLRREFAAWATPPTTGMGSGIHSEMWPALTPSQRRRMLEILGEKRDD